MFLSFNRIKDLCSTVEELAAAVQGSDLLETGTAEELSKELHDTVFKKEALLVRRKTPLPDNVNFDAQTVYLVRHRMPR